MQIQDKVAVVTGGGSGIGQATAVQLARLGAYVLVADLQADGSAITVEQITAAGGKALARQVDVSDPAAIDAMLAFAQEKLGGIDILINNAGIVTPGGYPGAARADWERVLDVNLRAVIAGTQSVLPYLRQRGGGSIVSTASMAAFVGFPPDPVYAATKGAVLMFTHSLAHLASEGIYVSCVCPGLVDTPLLRRSTGDGAPPPWLAMIRMLSADNIAAAVIELVQNDAAGKALQVMPGSRNFADIPSITMPLPRP